MLSSKEAFYFLLKLGICKVIYKWVDRSVQCDNVIEINIEQVAIPGYLIFGVKKTAKLLKRLDRQTMSENKLSGGQ